MSEPSSNEEAFDLIQRGRNLRDCGLPVAALKFYRRASRLTPRSDLVRHEMRLAREQIQQLLAIVERFEQGLPRPATDSQALLELADALIRLNREEEAIAATKRAVAVDPQNVQALYQLGNRLNTYDRYEDAVAVFDRLLALEPDVAHFWLVKGMVLCNIGSFRANQSAYKQAMEILDRALALNIGTADKRVGFQLKAQALFGLGRNHEAQRLSKLAAQMRRRELGLD